jgi:hypothetical protein
MQDAMRKHRMKGLLGSGEMNLNAKLTQEQAQVIRGMKGWYPSRLLADAFGVTKTAVLDIWASNTWRRC